LISIKIINLLTSLTVTRMNLSAIYVANWLLNNVRWHISIFDVSFLLEIGQKCTCLFFGCMVELVGFIIR
jgi:hypothetical protein